ncbi:hypothetical protein CDC56_09200 [Staphylococcus aureus]|nr:hypothetical protein CDC56_09200 [Staphylococcus aureus]
MQVGDGPQQREIGFPISTDNASWVGRRNKFCENIISVPLPLNICVATLFLSCPSRENNTTYNAKYSNCYK